MNDKFKIVLTFILGASTASLITWKFAKKKYELIAQEEIDSVKKAFSNRPIGVTAKIEFSDEPKLKANLAKQKPDINKYSEKFNVQSETKSELHNEETYAIDEDGFRLPYVISPDLFGENDYWDIITLKLYSDDVITNEKDEMIDDIESLIGENSLNHFGEYEDDCVYVRNERLERDFEILRMHETYERAMGKIE